MDGDIDDEVDNLNDSVFSNFDVNPAEYFLHYSKV
jgi:hypothetical protein